MGASAMDGHAMTHDASGHLDETTVAEYVDNLLEAREMERARHHLAACRHCRDEVVSVQALRRELTSPRRSPATWIAGVAAAALLLMVVPGDPAREPVHREAPMASIGAPRAIAPVGEVAAAPRLTWSAVPNADRYVVRVFGDEGDVLWEADTRDTSAVVATALLQGRRYFWKVEAHTGFGRSVSTELVDFTIRGSR